MAVFAGAYLYTSGGEKRAEADAIIQTAADRLRERLEYARKKDNITDHTIGLGEAEGMGGILTSLALLRQTVPGAVCPLSGAGNGMAGIAEALCSAADVLGDDRYIAAAKDALEHEHAIYERYSSRFGTWADLSSYPPERYRHGYCSGAPGIGIMLERIKKTSCDIAAVKALSELAYKSVETLPLRSAVILAHAPA